MEKITIFRKTLWFENRHRFDIDYFDMLLPKRTVSEKVRYKSGIFYSEKCGRYIQYESGLELDFIKQLEASPQIRFYYEQPVRIPYWRGKIKASYYPDFMVYLKTGEVVIVELKPLDEMLTHRVQAKIEGLMEFCSRRGFGLLLTDGKHVPGDLAKGKVNRLLEKELKAALADHPLREAEYRKIKLRCNATPSELYRAILRLDLKYSTRRFKLQYGNQSPVFRQVYFRKKKYGDITDENVLQLFQRLPV